MNTQLRKAFGLSKAQAARDYSTVGSLDDELAASAEAKIVLSGMSRPDPEMKLEMLRAKMFRHAEQLQELQTFLQGQEYANGDITMKKMQK